MFPRIFSALLAIVVLGMDSTMIDAAVLASMTTLSSSTPLSLATFQNYPSSSSSSSSSLLSSSATTGYAVKQYSTVTTATGITDSISNSISSSSNNNNLDSISTTTITPSFEFGIGKSASASSLNSATGSSLSLLSSSSLLLQQQQKIHLENSKSALDTNVTVQIGNHAYLPCNVKSLSGKPVSWVRVRDGHILTVDLTLFIADERFQAIYHENKQKWSLQIKYSQPHDMGLYECQVSSEPKKSSRVFLNVVVPKTELIGDHNRFVKAGSKVALHCIVLGSIEPPSYIIWYKGNQQIAQDNRKGWYMQIDREIFGNSSDQQNTIGSLIIPSVTKKDSGNYTCSPSNSASVTVDLHVLSGEYSASAIMSSSVKVSQKNIFILILFMLFALLKFT